MKFRTDLAIEKKELIEEQNVVCGENDGIIVEEKVYDEDIFCTRIRIVDEMGAAKLEKPPGNYITLEVQGIFNDKESVKERAGKALAEELGKMVSFHPNLKVLVCGLGNDQVTPDALGPHTADKVRATRHLFDILDAGEDEIISNVSCITPGVTGMTGIETAELIKSAARLTLPEAVIIIDALAAKSIKRVSTTIQINDAGIEPGSGTGNMRAGIDSEYLGCRVISVGVPTVIDAATIIGEALEEGFPEAVETEKYIKKHHRQMIVTSTDIDMIIKDFSDIIANGINKTLHPGIYF